jgi:anti-sigma factor RsiW
MSWVMLAAVMFVPALVFGAIWQLFPSPDEPPRWRTFVANRLERLADRIRPARPPEYDPFTTLRVQERLSVVADHVRALQIGPLAEVVSTDRHTVKPWVQGRLDYAPPVFDLAAEGFPLMGGRIEHVRGNVVATLAYARERHVIDVFVWPSTAQQAPTRSLRKGFNVLHWADGSMQYWAVSDLERGEMERFARLWRERVAAQ